MPKKCSPGEVDPAPYIRPIILARDAALKLTDCLETLWGPAPSGRKPSKDAVARARQDLLSVATNAANAIGDVLQDLTQACGSDRVEQVGTQSETLSHLLVLKLADQANESPLAVVLVDAIRPKLGDWDRLRAGIARESMALVKWRGQQAAISTNPPKRVKNKKSTLLARRPTLGERNPREENMRRFLVRRWNNARIGGLSKKEFMKDISDDPEWKRLGGQRVTVAYLNKSLDWARRNNGALPKAISE